jgi:glycosyltransferase involved in cell wall biosynthesis
MISVVIPIHDEAESLEALHAELGAVFGKFLLGPVEFLFVDDGSRDQSWEVLAEIARRDSRVTAIRFRRNFGKAAALVAAFQKARGELVFTMDGDLQDDPAEIPRFLATIERGFDVVSGWKKKRYDPWHKVYPSRLFNATVSKLTGCRLHDHNCGFKLYRKQVLNEIGIYGELHRFIPVLAHARGFKVGEIEVRHRSRKHGISKYGFSRLIKGFLDLLTVRFLTRFGQRPLHVLGGVGITLFGLGALGMSYLALVWLDPNHEPIGTRPLLSYSLACLIVGVQLLSLGVLAELVTSYNIRAEDTFSIAETIAGQGKVADGQGKVADGQAGPEATPLHPEPSPVPAAPPAL